MVLDAGMFFSLLLLRPHRTTLPFTFLCHLLFHGFTFLVRVRVRVRVGLGLGSPQPEPEPEPEP